jgi:hypothetical protein
MAVDGATTTFSLTTDEPGSYWLAELGRPYPVERIESSIARPRLTSSWRPDASLVQPRRPGGVQQRTLANPGPLGLIVIICRRTHGPFALDRPARARHQRGGQPSRWPDRSAALWDPGTPVRTGPVILQTNSVNVWQSSEYGGYPAENAVDGNPDTFTHTADGRQLLDGRLRPGPAHRPRRDREPEQLLRRPARRPGAAHLRRRLEQYRLHRAFESRPGRHLGLHARPRHAGSLAAGRASRTASSTAAAITMSPWPKHAFSPSGTNVLIPARSCPCR